MKESFLSRVFSSPRLDSRVHSANTQKSEMWLGYFAGPCFVYMVYFAVAGTYLTQFYTDVLGLAGIFLTLMPLFSKIFDAITNIIMGRIIDRTRTRQGKARPWAAEPTPTMRMITGRIMVTRRPGIMFIPALVIMARPSRCLVLRVESGTINA